MAESIGAAFGGLILGVIAMRTGSIFGGIIVHIGVAMMMEAGAYAQLYLFGN
jgi:membrane protease YdiL (CAAX protease family)